MNFENFIDQVLKDIQVELDDEFDRNFERKAFFDRLWPPAKYPAREGSLMMRSGDLRNGLGSEIRGNSIHYTDTEDYAEIQNEGGTITVTAQMKKYFWARYYRATGRITKTKTGRTSNSQRNRDLGEEALFYKRMALMKVGSKITIPERRFIGEHPQVDRAVKSVIDDNMEELNKQIAKELKQK